MTGCIKKRKCDNGGTLREVENKGASAGRGGRFRKQTHKRDRWSLPLLKKKRDLRESGIILRYAEEVKRKGHSFEEPDICWGGRQAQRKKIRPVRKRGRRKKKKSRNRERGRHCYPLPSEEGGGGAPSRSTSGSTLSGKRKSSCFQIISTYKHIKKGNDLQRK